MSLEAFIFYYLASTETLPGLAWVIALTTLVAFCTSIYSFVVNNSRFRWVSKAQAGTDYSMQSSLWNLGIWAAGSVAGIVAGALGWPHFFLIAAATSLIAGLYYVLNFNRIEQLVIAREKLELAQDSQG